jgi:uroporphyrinogen III methyltransferase / synthase
MNELSGKRILVTRPRVQSVDFIEKIITLGAVPVIFPTIEISPVNDTTQLDKAIIHLNNYHWVIFTSVNGVAVFWDRLSAMGKGNNDLLGIQIAAIGPATANALSEKGIRPDFVPEEYVAEAILPGLGDVRGKKVLLPRAEIARKALLDALINQGAIADEIAIYRTLPVNPDPQAFVELEKGIDIATFTSSSTVTNYFDLTGERALDLLKEAVIACIGPITAETARTLGLEVTIIAEEYTVDGLIDAILIYEQHVSREKSNGDSQQTFQENGARN